MTDAERLAAYDRLYADLLKERDQVISRLEEQRAAGKVRGATHQQVLAQKLTLQNFLSRFALYGIREDDRPGAGADTTP